MRFKWWPTSHQREKDEGKKFVQEVDERGIRVHLSVSRNKATIVKNGLGASVEKAMGSK